MGCRELTGWVIAHIFEASLGYIVSSRLARSTAGDLALTKQTNIQTDKSKTQKTDKKQRENRFLKVDFQFQTFLS